MFGEDFEEAFAIFLEKVRLTEDFRNYKATFAAIQDDDTAMGCVESIRELNMQVMDMDEDEYERESENIALRMKSYAPIQGSVILYSLRSSFPRCTSI